MSYSSGTAAVMAREKKKEDIVSQKDLVTSQQVMYTGPMDPVPAMPISEFKAKCLGVVDDIATTGVPLTLTKRGHAVVRVIPIESVSAPLKGTWADSVRINGDVVNFDLSGDWEEPSS